MPSQPQNHSEWDKIAAKVFEEMVEWQKTHPQAKFGEIEEAIDQRLAKLRSQMLQDSTQAQEGQILLDQPKCETCGVKLQKRGKHLRRVLSERGENIELERDYLVCPQCKVGLFPPR